MMPKDSSFPFSNVYCISLPISIDRRQWIKCELHKNSVPGFEFIDAINRDDPVVEQAYENGTVKLYPPCFRCGKNACDHENNVLIEPQVATFFSHMKAWSAVADQVEGMYLIIEDDIKFNRYYSLLKGVYHKKINALVQEKIGDPLLLRLAWAFNDDHKLQEIRFSEGLLRWSNPTYAINPKMAKVLLKEFSVIDDTVDVYVHKKIGKKYNNYTLLPPLAHELSFSHGKVESLIRPRAKRLEELQKKSDRQSKDELKRYNSHIDKAISRRLLVTGCYQSGTDDIARIIGAYGLDIGHEEMGADGIVSWAFAVYDLENPRYRNKYARSRYFVSFEETIMYAQDPYTTIPALMVRSGETDDIYRFINKHITRTFNVSIEEIDNELQRAAAIYYYWSKVAIENNRPGLVVRVEHDEELLKQFLADNGYSINLDQRPDEKARYKGDLSQGQKKSAMDKDGWLALEREWKVKINELCEILDYEPIFTSSLANLNR